MIRLPKNDPWYDDGFSEPYEAANHLPLTTLRTDGTLGVSSSDLKRFIANVGRDREALRELGWRREVESSEPNEIVVNGFTLSKVNGRWRLVVPEYRDGYAIFESESRTALEEFARSL